jgi:Flp pilus assembly pilin Flp
MWNYVGLLAQSLAARATVKREDGQALVEYSLILALVSVVAIALLTAIGNDIITELGKVTTAL